MTAIAAFLATLAAFVGFGTPTITTPDGWILPDVENVVRCHHDQNLTLCVDTVTAKRYMNGQPVAF